MSIGPSAGIVGSAAGAPLSQTRGSELERSQQESANQQRQVAGEKSAADSAGVGQASEDQEASERDADGRRLWEATPESETSAAETEVDEQPQRQSKDATGDSGHQLDLSG